MRDAAEIVDLVRRIGALVKSGSVDPAAKWEASLWSGPITHRFRFINGRANESACICTDNGANRCPTHISSDRSAQDRA